MSAITRTGSGDLFALDEDDGAVMAVGADGYVTLGVDTYLFPLGGISDAIIESCHILTDATIAGTFTIEGCNFPKFVGGMGGGTSDVSDWVNAGSVWTQINPSTALVDSVGTGWTWTALSGAKTAGVGSALINLGNLGCRRARLKVVVTTGGKVRVNAHGKS